MDHGSRAPAPDYKPERDEEWKSHRVAIKEMVEADLPFFHELATSIPTGRRFTLAGAGMSLQRFSASAWEGVLCHLLISGRASYSRLGVFTVASADMRNSTAYVSIVGDSSVAGTGLVAEGLCLCLDYVFDTWPFRKIYGEVPEYNYDRFSSGDHRFFTVEGRLTRHLYMAGGLRDVLILAISRERWMETGRPIANRLRGGIPLS